MPTNITDVDTFSATVTAPADGDAGNGATFQAGIQLLSNRSRNLKNRIDALAAARTVTRVGESSHRVTLNAAGDWVKDAESQWESGVNSGRLNVHVNELLVHGAALTSISVVVIPGAVRAGANRMRARLYRATLDYSATTLLSGTSHYDDGTTNSQTITATPSAPHTIDLENYLYTIDVDAGNTGAADKDYLVGGVKCICAQPEITYP